MPATSLAAFWLLAALLIAVPGPDWAFTLGAGLRARSVLPAVAGLVAGYSLLTAAVALGVGALVAASPSALRLLTLCGGAYLIRLGAATLRHPGEVVVPGDVRPGGWPVFARGLAVSGLNPKALLLFVALLPQFTDPRAAWPLPAQLAALGLTFVLTCAAFYAALGSAARTLLRRRPGTARAAGRLAGAAMVLLGAALLLRLT
jgi:threonine/homoserine/homoserine lactone efflux protein